jgi:dihydrodipicolinate synthase/N-acetylneuraminate lyase
VVEAVVRAAAGRLPVIAGSGRASTAATLELSRRLAGAGADGLLVLTPHVYRAAGEPSALRRHYASVAAGAPVPVFVYHLPDVTGIDLDAEVLAQLVALPNIWGFKDSSLQGGPLQQTLTRARTIGLVGSGTRLLEGLEAGAAGGILAIANAIPETCVAVHSAWQRRDPAAAQALQAKAAVFTRALRPWGVAGIKAALAIRGWLETEVRAPLVLPAAADRDRIAAALQQALA